MQFALVCKNDKTVISMYLSIITLNVNTLKFSTKGQGVAEWIKKKIYILLIRDSLQSSRHTHTENEGMEKDIPCKRKQKER